MNHHQVLIVGGGSAGIAVGAILRKQPNPPDVTIIEPSEEHFYQPLWTLVGAGVYPKAVSVRREASYIPPGANWIKATVASFDPDKHSLTLENGDTHSYDVLVVTAGIQINWNTIPGLVESVGKPGTGVCSNYSYDTADMTWEIIRNLKSGTALFSHPATPVKCGGAPLKIAFLASDHWRRNHLGRQVRKKFIKGGPSIFAVKKYADTLTHVAERYELETIWQNDLVALRPDSKEAVFHHLDTGEERVEKYDMIHVTPPMSPPDFIKNSPLSTDDGWVSVDPHTTQHTRFSNVFSLGDCSNLPTSKTGAAIRKQASTSAANVMAFRGGNPLPKSYDGYTACPVVTGYGKLVLAEFDYDKQPKETFPFNQARERFSMYALKAYVLPQMYWHGMLRGREF